MLKNKKTKNLLSPNRTTLLTIYNKKALNRVRPSKNTSKPRKI